MLHPSTKRLIDKLSEMTRKQRVTWTEGENATVVHDTEGYRVVLTPEPHAVLLTDALGREIETCLPEEFADEVDAHGRPYSKFITELYREASRHARGTEKAIRTLLAGLDAVETEAASHLPPAPVQAAVALLDAPDATTDETAPIESETEITAAVANLADKINAPQVEPMAEPVVEEMVVATVEAEPEVTPEPIVEDAPVLTQAEAEPEIEIEPLLPEEPEMVVEEPGSFGTFGAFEGQTEPAGPAPEAAPVEAAATEEIEPETAAVEPAPEPVAEPEAAQPEPALAAEPEPQTPAPTLTQPISLSSIPFGFGLGAAQRASAPSHPSTSAPERAPEAPSDTPRRLVIDGTADLPDALPSDFDDAVSAESYPPPAPETGPRDLPNESTPAAVEPGNPRRFNPWN